MRVRPVVSRVLAAFVGGLSLTVLVSGVQGPVYATPTDPAAPTDATAPAAAPETGESSRPDRVSAMVTARATGERVEDLSQRDETTRVFANPEGTWTSQTASEPVRVQDETGAWHRIDPTLVEVDGGWAPRYAAADVVFSAGGDRAFAAVNAAGRDLRWRWAGEQTLPEPVVEGDTATYRNVVPGGDLVVTAFNTGFSHSIVLHRRPVGPVEFEIPVVTDGATLTENPGGGLAVTTPAGRDLVTAPAPLMWDSSANAAGEPANVAPVETTIGETAGGTPSMTLAPDQGFLADPGTVYPVVVDPTFSTFASGDAWVQNKDFTTGQYASKELRAGTYDAGVHIARSFIHFDNNMAALKGQHVESASLVLRNFDSSTCGTASVEARRITEAWDGAQMTWANKPSGTTAGADVFHAAYGYSSACPAADATWNVRDIVQEWAKDPSTNHGILLRATYEDNSKSWRKYRSSNYNDHPNTEPMLQITHSSYPNTADAATVAPVSSYAPPSGAAGWYTADRTPTFTSKATDADGGKVQLRFEVYATTAAAGSPLATCTTGPVAQGSTGSCTIPTALADGETDFVRVKAFDGKAWAGGSLEATKGWSTWTSFKVAAGTPAAPTISCPAPYGDGSWTDTVPATAVECTLTGTGTGTSAPGYIRWSLNGAPETRVRIAQSSDPTVARTTVRVPSSPGGYELSAVAESPAGKSSTTTRHGFGYGQLAMTHPTPGQVATTAGDVEIDVAGPPTGDTTVPDATLRWRVASSGAGAASGWNTTAAPLQVVNDGPAGIRVTGSWDATTAARDDALGVDLDPRVPALLEVQVCVTYPADATTPVCTWPQTPARVLRVPHAFGAGFPVVEAGPGQVALWTGELSTSVTDVQVSAFSGSLSLARTHSTFADPADGAAGVFGPGWTAHLDGPDAGAAGMLVIDQTPLDGTLVLADPTGALLAFAATATPQRRTTADLPTGAYVPVDEDTALAGVKLAVAGTGPDTRVVFTDVDGTVTTFRATTAPTTARAGEFAPATVVEPGGQATTAYSYDAQGRVTRILAPVPAGVTCPDPALNTPTDQLPGLADGCRALDLTYGAEGRLAEVVFRHGTTSTVVATYGYDTDGRLVTVTDPRTGLVTGYGYDGASTRLATLTPPGQAAFGFHYGTAAGGTRLQRVTRPDPDTGAETRLATYLYQVPVDGSGGTPNLTGDAATWGQDPTTVGRHGFAVFGADQQSVATDPATVSPEQWRYASLSYTDDRGYVRNTAEFGAGRWLYTETDYDTQGNVTAQYGTGEIAAIRDGASRAEAGTLYRYDPVTQPVGDGTDRVTLPAGGVVTDVYQPARTVLLGGEPQTVRPHTAYTHDQDAPDNGVNPATGQGYGLVTTTTLTAAHADATGDIGTALTQTRTGYEPLDPALTRTEVWQRGLPTTVTRVMDGPAEDITTRTRYDAQGRVVETRQPKSSGADAGTRFTRYYTADTHPTTPECGNKPAWAGAVCRIEHGTGDGSGPQMPVTTITDYDPAYLAPTTLTETVGATVARTTRSSYDSAGRVTKTWTTSSLANSPPAPGAVYGYHPDSGLSTTVTATDDTGTPNGPAIETGYDTWGRATRYTPVPGETTTTRYDTAGRVATITDPKGTTSYTYDGGSGTDAVGNLERRGLPTGLTVTNGTGTLSFAAAYDATGTLATHKLPGGITQRVDTDPVGQPVGLTYSGTVTNPDGTTSPDDPWLGWSQTRDLLGRVTVEWTPAGAAFTSQLGNSTAAGYSRAYDYDQAGRLVTVQDHTMPAGTGTADQTPAPGTGTVCQTRRYTFDANGNRLSLTRSGANPDGSCATTTASTRTWNYDSADRLTGGYVYDQLGRQTTIPAADTPNGTTDGDLSVGYYTNDAVHTTTQNGATTSYTLDAAGRRATATSGGSTSETLEQHYTDPGDNPTWVTTTTTPTGTSTTRYLDTLGGLLGATITNGTTNLTINDPHGDTVTTIPIPTSGPATGITGWTDTDEYGNHHTTPTNQPGPDYHWLGAHQRATTTTGLLLMGARLYNPTTGTFTSTDPIHGANTTAYTYPQDPVNDHDLDGQMPCAKCLGGGGGGGVYVLWFRGGGAYVGMTRNFARRIPQHFRSTGRFYKESVTRIDHYHRTDLNRLKLRIAEQRTMNAIRRRHGQDFLRNRRNEIQNRLWIKYKITP